MHITRRRLFQQASAGAVALSVAAVPAVAQAEEGDAFLLRLGQDLAASYAEEIATSGRYAAARSHEASRAHDAAFDRSEALSREIMAIRATTAAGMRVKAEAVRRCWRGSASEVWRRSTDARLIASLMEDLGVAMDRADLAFLMPAAVNGVGFARAGRA